MQTILESALQNMEKFTAMDGLLAPGTDAGAWAVPHGSQTERPLLYQAGLTDDAINGANELIRQRF